MRALDVSAAVRAPLCLPRAPLSSSARPPPVRAVAVGACPRSCAECGRLQSGRLLLSFVIQSFICTAGNQKRRYP